jgi:hypothetical protein
LTSAAHKEKLVELIGEANTAGSGLVSACGVIDERLLTLKYW